MKINPDIFRSYDIRAQYPSDINKEVAYKIGQAFAVYSKVQKVAVGGDVRNSTPEIKEGLTKGLTDQGVDVLDLGLVSTDATYFSAHYYDFKGTIMVTASHMPPQYNGLKFMLNLKPIGKGSGIEELRDITIKGSFKKSDDKGKVTEKDIWEDYKNFLFNFVKEDKIKDLKVVMDAGNGVGGYVAEKVYSDLPINIIPLYFKPDGDFPNHEANPILPENRIDIEKKVPQVKADLGIAWDADCDRVYFIDEKGSYVHGDFITALIAKHFINKNLGNTVVYDLRASDVVKNTVEELGGTAVSEKVGHTYIKHTMREHDAVFGGEVSGHYYYKDNAYADNGFIAPLIIFEMMSVFNKSLSELIEELGSYYVSGEINSKVEDVDKVINNLKSNYSNGTQDFTDGISVRFKNWKFNVRPSSNDPVIRLNLEANSKELMKEKRDEVLRIIRDRS